MNKPSALIMPASIDYGETVSFGRQGSVLRLETCGFDLSDGEQHSWTQRQTAEIEFGLRLPNERVELAFEALPFLPPTVAAQQVFVFLNGLIVGFTSLSERQVVSFPIARNSVSSRQNRLTFVIPTAVSPYALGLGDNRRQLGVALTSLRFALA